MPLVAMYASCPPIPVAFKIGAPSAITVWMKAAELKNPDNAPTTTRTGVVISNLRIIKVAVREKMIEENSIAITGFMIG